MRTAMRVAAIASLVGACDVPHRASPDAAEVHFGFVITRPHVLECSACHVLGTNTAADISCTTSACHQQAQTQALHADLTSYRWTDEVPSRCLTCHRHGLN